MIEVDFVAVYMVCADDGGRDAACPPPAVAGQAHLPRWGKCRLARHHGPLTPANYQLLGLNYQKN